MRRSSQPPDVISVHMVSQTSEDSDRTSEGRSSPEVVGGADLDHKPHPIADSKAERRPGAISCPESNREEICSKRSIPGMAEADSKRPRLGKEQSHASQNRKHRKDNADSGASCTSTSYGGRVRRRAVFVDGVSYRYVQRTVSQCQGQLVRVSCTHIYACFVVMSVQMWFVCAGYSTPSA